MKSVLVVEDEPTLRRVYSDAIQGQGYAVIEAGLASSALRLLENAAPDLILLDIMMPRGEMDGIEFLARLKEKRPRAGIPVLIVSALGHDVNVELTARLGVRGIVPKPAAIDTLTDRIRRIIGPGSALPAG